MTKKQFFLLAKAIEEHRAEIEEAGVLADVHAIVQPAVDFDCTPQQVSEACEVAEVAWQRRAAVQEGKQRRSDMQVLAEALMCQYTDGMIPDEVAVEVQRIADGR